MARLLGSSPPSSSGLLSTPLNLSVPVSSSEQQGQAEHLPHGTVGPVCSGQRPAHSGAASAAAAVFFLRSQAALLGDRPSNSVSLLKGHPLFYFIILLQFKHTQQLGTDF